MEDTAEAPSGREEVFALLRKRFLNAARRWFPQHAAEDLAHETIKFLLEEYGEYAYVELLYIGIKVLSFRVLEWRRREARFAPLGPSSPDEQRKDEEAGNVDQREAWKKTAVGARNKNREEDETVRRLSLSSLLSSLSGDCKKLIRMRRAGKSHKDIQEELGLPTANAAAARLAECIRRVLSREQPRTSGIKARRDQ